MGVQLYSMDHEDSVPGDTFGGGYFFANLLTPYIDRDHGPTKTILRQTLDHHPSGQGQWSGVSAAKAISTMEVPCCHPPLEVFIGRVPGTPQKKITNQQRTPNEEQNNQAIQKRKGL